MPTRYEKEIQHILDESTRQTTWTNTNNSSISDESPEPNGNSSKVSERTQRSIRQVFRITTSKIVAVGLVSMLLAALLRWLLPSASSPLVWAGISLFIIAYLKYFIGPRRPTERRWRGQIIELDPHHQSSPLVDVIKRLLKFRKF